MKSKNILITGAEGFIARNIALFLKNKKFKLYGIGRKKFNKKISSKFGYKIILNANINLSNLKKNFKKIDLIIHCAGSATAGSSKKNNYKKNYLTTKAVANFSILFKKKPKVIFLSSYSVYGGNFLKPLKENFFLKPLSSYARTKKISEELLLKYRRLYNLDILILRLASIYGEGLKKQLIFDACEKIINNNKIFYGTGKEVRDWLHISDFCNLLYKLIKNDTKKVIILNCGSGKGNKVRSVLEFIKKKLNSNIKIKFISKEKIPKILIADISLAKMFNWSPKINLKKGLLRYIKWFLKNND